MKNKSHISTAFFAMLVFSFFAQSVSAQTFPPDTTTYWMLNSSGVSIPVHRGLDNTMYKGQLIIRFRQNALDYNKLLDTYIDWYYDPYRAHHSKGNQVLDYPPFPCDSNRGFPDSLRKYLKLERFYIDSSSNIILDTVLKMFLHTVGGKYLRRLTTASPRDLYSVTRRGDTIGCDHYNWMILTFDTTVNDLALSFALTSTFPKDIYYAEPDRRHVGKLLHTTPSHPHDNGVYYDKCEYSLYNMINAPKAWDYEVGKPKILLAHFDEGADFMHPDLGGGIGAGYHVRFGEQFSIDTFGVFEDINRHQGHGTPCLGIMGALTNRNATSIAGIAGGWGVLPSDPSGSVDEGMGCSLAILAASNFGTTHESMSEYVAAIFQASARSDSSEYGYGANVINTSADVAGDDYASIHAAINYGFLNGVVQVASMENNDADETSQGFFNRCWPANYEEPWIIAVGGSQPNKTRITGSDYGYTMDLIAPAGDPTAGFTVASDIYGPIVCSNNDSLGNWNETFSMANIQADAGLLEVTNPKFTYRGFGGTSAAAAHVTGSAGLLLSTALNNTDLKLEPEDVGGILKASAFRPSGVSSRQLQTAWGHLDIGHAYEMLDPIPLITNTKNLYFLNHFHFEDSLQFTAWSDKRFYYFEVCWDSSIVSNGTDTIKKKYGNWQFVLNDNHVAGGIPFSYKASVRTVSRTVTLPPYWVIDSVNSPLFAWGRSGGLGEKSGWDFSTYNWQTGWSRVNSSTGGDTLNEGIFHNQGTTFNVVTAQYDVWAWNADSNDYKTYIGHIPDDTLMGVNFSVFGRKDLTYYSVNSQQASGNENLLVSVNPQGDRLTARFFSDKDIDHPKLEIYDILGRFMTSFSENHAEQG